MKILVDDEATERLIDFFADEDKSRCVIVPSLNSGFLSKPDNGNFSVYPNEETNINLKTGCRRIKILTDLFNNVDWKLLEKIVSMENVEIRHHKGLDLNLYIYPRESYCLTLVKEYNNVIGVHEDEFVLFESTIDDYNSHRMIWMFNDLWDEAENITQEKLNLFIKFCNQEQKTLYFNENDLAETYFLFSILDTAYDTLGTSFMDGVFCSRIYIKDKFAAFPYIMGIDIPKDAKYFVHCVFHKDSQEFNIYRALVVDSSYSIKFDDNLWRRAKDLYDQEKFLVIVPNYLDASDLDYYTSLILKFDLPCSSAKTNKYFMVSEAFCWKKKKREIESFLTEKYRTSQKFRTKLSKTNFIKWTEI